MRATKLAEEMEMPEAMAFSLDGDDPTWTTAD